MLSTTVNWVWLFGGSLVGDKLLQLTARTDSVAHVRVVGSNYVQHINPLQLQSQVQVLSFALLWPQVIPAITVSAASLSCFLGPVSPFHVIAVWYSLIMQEWNSSLQDKYYRCHGKEEVPASCQLPLVSLSTAQLIDVRSNTNSSVCDGMLEQNEE